MSKTNELPLSGSESKFTNRRWGSGKGITSNNCYAYAVGSYEAYRWQKSVPGDRSHIIIQNATISQGALFQITQN